jgi:bacteriorhodopsin
VAAAGYPVLFMLGQEGFFGILSPWNSVLAHCIVDVLSKNVSRDLPVAVWPVSTPGV